MGGAVNCVMTAMMAMMMTSGAVGCDGGYEEGGCDKDPHGDFGCLCEVLFGCELISYCCCVVNMSALYSIECCCAVAVVLLNVLPRHAGAGGVNNSRRGALIKLGLLLNPSRQQAPT